MRYLTCSGLIPAGNAATEPSRAARLTPDALAAALRPAMAYAVQQGIEINFTSPGWLREETLHELGFTQIPSCGACLSNMAVAPRRQPYCPARAGFRARGWAICCALPWHRIWRSAECCAIRNGSAAMDHRCQLGATPLQEGCS